MANHRTLVGLFLVVAAGGACVGSVPGGASDEAPRGGAGSDPSGVSQKPGSGPGPSTAVPPGGLSWPVRYDGQPSALRRLSRDELVASMEALTGSAPVRDDLPEEQRPGRGALLLSGTSFLATELGKLKQVLGDFATRVAPTMLTRSGCAQTGQAQRDCLLGWATKLAEQALRRPARPSELMRFQTILQLAGSTKDDDAAAVQGVLSALFFAPSFLYRTEIGTAVAGKPGLRALEGNEIATRLSYLAALSPPDAELLDAARTGRLKDGAERVRQFARLAASDRGKRALSVFVLEWLGANEKHVNQKSPKYLTGLGTDFETTIRTSVEGAIRKVVLESGDPTVAGLLSTDSYLTDAAVQKIRQPAGTGRTASGDTDETGRIGLMMHPHVLAAHTKEDGASPFQVGVFMREALLCEPIPQPPPGAADMAKTDVPAGATMRESLEYRTSDGICRACHSQFAPIGYAYMPFDPVGRWVRQDPTGKAWDLSGSITPSASAAMTFKSPNDLTRQLAADPQVHGCFAQAALQWTLGRQLVMEDQDMVVALDDVARKTHGGVSAILQAIVSAPGFATTIAAR